MAIDDSGGGGDWSVLDTIKAVSALAVAAGAGYSAYAASKNQKKQLAFQGDQLAQQGQFHIDDMKQMEENRKLQQEQIDNQKPLTAMSLLSGLQDYKTKRLANGSYLDTVRALGRS